MQKGSIKLPFEQLAPGMVLAGPITHPATRQTIWAAGTILTRTHLDAMRAMQLSFVQVLDFEGREKLGNFVPPEEETPKEAKKMEQPFRQAIQWAKESREGIEKVATTIGKALPHVKTSGPLTPPPKAARPPKAMQKAIGHEVLVRNVNIVRQIGEQVKHSVSLNFQQVDTCVQHTIHKIIANKDLINSLVDLRVYDEYTYSHSANVMSLALVTGYALKYSPEKLRVLGIGALLHDLGKNMVPDEVLNKPGRLTPEEFEVMRTHPSNGVMLLNHYSWANTEIRNIVFQHHEKLDGTGYPMKVKGEGISEMARIVSVVDFYDALISERVYKKGLPPHVAYQAILDSMPSHFDPRIVQAFQAFIVPFPVNSLVLLNSGQIAKVLKVNRKHLLRPLILLEGKKIDLEKERRLAINTMVDPASPQAQQAFPL